MKKHNKSIALIISVLMIAALVAACGPAAPAPGPGAATPAPGQGGNIQQPAAPPAMVGDAEVAADAIFAEHIDIIKDNNNVGVLNPFSPAANNSPTNWSFIMIHDRLMELNFDTLEFTPRLATSWSTEDYQTFRFELRQGVTFHNGDPFTAQDVANTIEMARELGAGSQGGSFWAPVESVNIIDDHTIELTLASVRVDFYFNLAMPAAGILNRRAIEADDEQGFWVGTGPYMVENFVPNDFILFQRNHDFWNDELNIQTERMTLRFVPEMSARTIRMQRGESQLSFGTSAEDLPLFQADPDNFEVYPLTFNNPQGLSFNMNDPITGDHYFRMAVAHAMDKDVIALMAASEWAVGDYFSGTVWGYGTEFRNNNIPAIPHDPDLAREYLARSSYNGEEIEIAAAIITNIRASQALQQQLAAVGINTRIAEFDTPGLNAYMIDPNSGSQMVFFNVVMNMSSASFRNIFYPGGAQNRMQYNNPIVTQMLDEVATMLDPADREAHFMRLQEIVAEDIPFINVFWRINGILAANGIGGLRLPPDNQQADMRELFMVIG